MENLLVGIISLGLIVYLAFSMIRPEKFKLRLFENHIENEHPRLAGIGDLSDRPHIDH